MIRECVTHSGSGQADMDVSVELVLTLPSEPGRRIKQDPFLAGWGGCEIKAIYIPNKRLRRER